jgi:methionyl-tRNA synthetase
MDLSQSRFDAVPAFVVVILVLLAVWETIWKGIALWRAGVDRSLVWFVLMFVLNTCGILEIIYIFAVSRPKRARDSAAPPLV